VRSHKVEELFWNVRKELDSENIKYAPLIYVVSPIIMSDVRSYMRRELVIGANFSEIVYADVRIVPMTDRYTVSYFATLRERLLIPLMYCDTKDVIDMFLEVNDFINYRIKVYPYGE